MQTKLLISLPRFSAFIQHHFTIMTQVLHWLEKGPGYSDRAGLVYDKNGL